MTVYSSIGRMSLMTRYQVNDSTMQRLYLLQELDQAVLLIESGLAVLQHKRLYKPTHFVFLTLIASGLERLMKIILCLHEIETNKKFLSIKQLKKLSHNLEDALNNIIERCFTSEYLKLPIARDDLAFLKNDDTFKLMIKILSDFGNQDRYIFMNGIVTPATSHEWPNRRWEDLEQSTMPSERYFHMLMNDSENLQLQVTYNIIICLETFIRALCRLFVLANLGEEARGKMAMISHFLMRDDELGKRKYDILGMD